MITVLCMVNMSSIFLQTLPSALARQNKVRAGTETEPLLAQSSSASPPAAADAPVPPLRDLFVRPVLISLLNHAFLSFCQMSYDVCIPPTILSKYLSP